MQGFNVLRHRLERQRAEAIGRGMMFYLCFDFVWTVSAKAVRRVKGSTPCEPCNPGARFLLIDPANP